jgi:hypothetical protein
MINPSATGWIDKYFLEQTFVSDDTDDASLYENSRATGFIFGHIIAINTTPTIDILNWKEEETSKVALLNTLFKMYIHNKKDVDYKEFAKVTTSFYSEMNPKGFQFLNKFISSDNSYKLENQIDERVQTNHDIISKNFSHIITNALLFVDVLCYNIYLKKHKVPENYLKKIEEIILSTITLVLKVKSKKSKYDDSLIKLFEASVRYSKFSQINHSTSLDDLNFEFLENYFEKNYIFDLACMAIWSDVKTEPEEIYFLEKLGQKIGLATVFIEKSIETSNSFFTSHKDEIQYFNYSNPVKHFYDQTSNTVELLIKRNKKRLTKELSESKELLHLLALSRKRNLDIEEKKKVKKQLLDICKSIPSLTIFLLPGGGLLLPILIKFIPQLLPSAFNENLDD